MTTDESSVPSYRPCHACGGLHPSKRNCCVCRGPRHGCEFLEGEGVLPLYRNETERMLRRYFYLSLDLGRLPSPVGEGAFRARVSCTRPHTFEDLVIFVHDIERRLEELAPDLLETIAAVVFLDQSHEEAAAALGLSRRQVERRYFTALDELSRRLLITGLMRASHSSLQEPDCEICLRNPAFVVSSEWPDEDEPHPGVSVTTATAGTDVTELGLPPKKPAASVRQVEGRRDEPRPAIVARLSGYVLLKTQR
jgi:hypothetical protein